MRYLTLLASLMCMALSVSAAKAGHHLAGTVVCHPGAIIPRSAMPAVRGLTA